ncbi:NAD(P)H-hydrate dehydratase [Leisingera sp. D0M16]|uniref:NAD(P)H-hydrate dehydratase n=1 Tax=Leisingera coralii TaxID=3351347 RepID=UPI003B804CB3
MTELLTAAQMRAIEQAAIESGEVTGLELMERAGQGVVDAIFEEWPELADERGAGPSRSPEYLEKDEKPRRAVVLCGPGNNGGDGFVVARLLKERGWAVEVFLYGDADKLPPDAKVNYERWREIGSEEPLTGGCLASVIEPDLLVDALFGTGLTRPLPDDIRKTFHWLLKFRPEWKEESPSRKTRRTLRKVAVDIPSGLSSDTGFPITDADETEEAADTEGGWPYFMSAVFHAHLTVTFHSPKISHFLGAVVINGTRVNVVDIGLRGDALERTVACEQDPDLERVRLLEPRFRWRPLRTPGFPHSMLEKSGGGHKYTEGHALVLSGGHGKTGAARLAARGALRIGAGLVTVGSPRSAMFENAANLTAIMLRQIDGAHGVSELLEDKRFNAVCLGPGLGRGADTQALAMAVLKEKRATVLDADALTRFELKPEALFEVLHENCVLTPHGGEFARLFPDLAEKLNAPATTGPAYSKVDATREAAKRAGCVVLFKGPDTVIAAPDGRCSVNSAHYERSAPWLATAGSGDVLAGFITGLLARGFSPMQAAETAAYLHVECALEFGPGLIAEDLPEQIPAVFRELGL